MMTARIHPILELVLRCTLLDVSTINRIARTCVACSIRCREDETWRRWYEALLVRFPELKDVFSKYPRRRTSLCEMIERTIGRFMFPVGCKRELERSVYDRRTGVHERTPEITHRFRALLLSIVRQHFVSDDSRIVDIPHYALIDAPLGCLLYFLVKIEGAAQKQIFILPVRHIAFLLDEHVEDNMFIIRSCLLRYEDFPHHLLQRPG